MVARGIGETDQQVTPQDCLSFLANMAAVATGIVAVVAGCNVLWRRRERRIRLEKYLEKERSDDEQLGHYGIRNIVHLMGNCSMSQAQVLEAAFASRKIRSWVAKDGEDGPDAVLMFQFSDKAWRQRAKPN